MNIWKSGSNRLFNYVFYLPFGGEWNFRRRCLDFFNIAKDDRVLDVCCGNGTLTGLIGDCLDHPGRVIGVDHSQSALKEAESLQNQQIAFTCASGENMPFGSSIFSRCIICFGLHHMNRQARQNTLQEIGRTLTTGGSLFVIEYNLPEKAVAKLVSRSLAKLDASPEAYPMLMCSNLIEELQKAGLKIKRRELIGRGIIQLVEAGE